MINTIYLHGEMPLPKGQCAGALDQGLQANVLTEPQHPEDLLGLMTQTEVQWLTASLQIECFHQHYPNGIIE